MRRNKYLERIIMACEATLDLDLMFNPSPKDEKMLKHIIKEVEEQLLNGSEVNDKRIYFLYKDISLINERMSFHAYGINPRFET